MAAVGKVCCVATGNERASAVPWHAKSEGAVDKLFGEEQLGKKGGAKCCKKEQ